MIQIAITLVILVLAAIFDLKYRRIPNYLTLPAVVSGLILNLYFSGWAGLQDAFTGALLGAALLFIPFALRGIGAGDVKLLAAVGALNGMNFVFFVFLYSAVAGGIMAIVVLLGKKLFPALFTTAMIFQNGLAASGGSEKASLTLGVKIPYGLAILAGTTAAWLLR